MTRLRSTERPRSPATMTSADVDARPVPAGPLAAPAPPGLGVCTGPASRRTVSTLRASSHAPNVSAITCGCACTHARTLTCAHSHAHLYDTCTKQCTCVHNIHLHKTTQYTHVCSAHACTHACSHTHSVSGGAEQRQAQPPGSSPGAVTPSVWRAGGAGANTLCGRCSPIVSKCVPSTPDSLCPQR